jgi:hypothetical protein
VSKEKMIVIPIEMAIPVGMTDSSSSGSPAFNGIPLG